MPKPLPDYHDSLESLSPFSLIKLIVLDLDGTLLESSDSELPTKVSALTSKLKYGNVLVTIATGRTLAGTRPLLDKLPISKKMPIILYNGSLVLNGKHDVLHQVSISTETFHQVINLCSNFNVKVIAYACDIFGGVGPSESAMGWSYLDKPLLEHNKMPVKWFNWDEFDNSITPSVIIIHSEGQAKTLSAISNKLKKMKDITYSFGGNLYIEVKPQNSNKGIALEFIAKQLQLNREQILAIGDNDNDAEMLSWAGIGVAIDSASNMARKKSDYIAKGGVINGAIEALMLVRSARRLLKPNISHAGNIKKISHTIKENKTSAEEVINDFMYSTYYSPFIDKVNALDFLNNTFNKSSDVTQLQRAIALGLLPIYKFENKTMILKSDLESFSDLLIISDEKITSQLPCENLIEQDALNIYPDTRIDLMHEDNISIPTFFSAAKNLISAHRKKLNNLNNKEFSMTYFSGTRLTTLLEHIHKFAKAQLEREGQIDINTISQFARSAHYMGSKRMLCGFLIEAISSVLPPNGQIIDLMCGSGVASGAFSRIWKTYSSDAQEFCRILAVIHGGGFDRITAYNLISKITPLFKKHFDELCKTFSETIKIEEKIFFSDTSENLLNEYKKFMRTYPTLNNLGNTDQWNPAIEVEKRRKNYLHYPYCLFTTYFANVYFGVRQSVEIDSLKFSIDNLQDENEKCWAMGALIATVSALGTTYGGHFAQPKIRNDKDVNNSNITYIIDKRSPAIFHEFTVRLLNLSEQSQKINRNIETIPGPWHNALSVLNEKLKTRPILVYLDAPYTREEYSRYYHVLETLVKYNYPSCNGIGLTPEPNDRFKSEFLTRKESRVEEHLVKIITNILYRNWMCAWSYSDSGMANMYRVIDAVHQKTNCDIKSYSAPFIHKSQGPRKHKKVTEYLIIFSPTDQTKK